jgi:predicted polyphosphate/ATP-dependent NAD kinase
VRIGFLVNPVAGMGGSVGLKGTDGRDIQEEAVRRGASRGSPARASVALRSLKECDLDAEILTCRGEMGEAELLAAALPHKVVYVPAGESTGTDTIAAVRMFVRDGVTLAIFVGGDGTARDVVEAADAKVPIVGVPAGVKMHSAVFLNRPEDLGPLVASFFREPAVKSAEVMDIDEDLFRKGIVSARLYGIAVVPDDRTHMQSGKTSYGSGSTEDEASEIGKYVADIMDPDVAYIVGPGSTTAAIAKALGVTKTLLGVDVFRDGRIIASDATEADLLKILSSGQKATIIVSPIGSQGFFLGRGNQQISPRVIEAVGTDNLVIVSTPTKLRDTSVLKVDSGDPALDQKLRRRTKVVTGYKRKKLVEVR